MILLFLLIKHKDTILRTLSSIAMQEIVEDVEVTIVNDVMELVIKKFDMFPYIRNCYGKEWGPGLSIWLYNKSIIY